MRTMASTLTALALALLLAAPAVAGGEQGNTVTKTLELTLHGEVPQDRVFGAFYYVSAETHPAGLVQFCGPQVEGGEPPSQVVSEKACTGDGSVYRAEVEFDRGTGVFVEFVTLSVSDPQNTLEIFTEIPEPENPESLRYETLDADATNSAWYRFEAGGNQQTPQMPATGSGGMSNDGAPVNGIAVGLSLVAAGGYAVRRRHWAGRGV